MKKSIFLFFAAILCAMNASAYKLYLYTGKVGWQDGNAKFQVWTNKNVNATKIGNNWYSFDVGTYSGTAYIKRNNPSGGTWDEFSVSISSTNNFARVTDWKKGEISSLHVTGDNWNSIGDWSNNNAAGKMTIDGNTFTKTFENVSAEAHTFKLTFKGTWDNAIGHGDHVSCVNGTVKGVDGNIEFTPKVAGSVTITYNMADGKIVITCATPKYTIATSANPAEGGTVTGGGTYEEGASVTLTATPNTGYEFENWTEGGSVVSNSATLEFNISKDRTLVANFKVPVPDAVKYQVNVSANDNTMGTVTGTGEYEENATAILTATPNAGYQFVNWTVGSTEKSTNPTYSFTVTENVTLVANFEEIPEETVYFINTNEWTGTINAYAWTDGTPKVENAGWAGLAATKEDFQIGGYDVYSYTAKQGLYANVIFNGTGGQTDDLTWQAGKYYAPLKKEWYDTKEAAAEALAAPVEYEYVYFINTNSWAAVNIYTWTPEVATWPGVAMTKETEQIAGFDVYSYKVVKGTTFGGMKFNEGKDKAQTGDLKWEAGKYYAPSKDKWYDTKEAAEAALAIPLADETVYFVNNKKWANVAIYGWNGTLTDGTGANKWPGAAMTKTAEQVAGFDVYSYTAKEGTLKNILFNHNGDENKTSDFVWTNGKYYYMDEGAQKDKNYAGGTKEEVAEIVAVPVVDNYYVSGTFNGWASNDAAKLTLNGELYTKELTLEAGAHMFKVQKNNWAGEWGYSNIKGAYVGMEEGTNDDGDKNNNIKLTLSTKTTFTVKFNLADNEITFGGLTEDETETLVYTVEVPEGTEKCYIAGKMNNWEFALMTQKDATHWTITYDNVLKDMKYKYACQASWDYKELNADGTDVADRTWKENDKVEKWGKPVIVTYQLKGVGGWDQPGIELVQNPDPEKASEYMLTCQAISATDAIKVVRLEDGVIKDYYGNGTVKDEVTVTVSYDGEANIKLPEGKYNFYFDTNEPDKKLWIAAATDCGTEPTPDYTRTGLTVGNYGTICLPYASDNFTGATFFEVAGKEGDKVFFDEVTTLEAGKPYIFLADETEIKVAQIGESADEAGKSNSLQGTFTQIDKAEDNILVGNYMVVNNVIKKCGANCGLEAYRAYFIAGELESLGAPSARVPGRRRVAIGQAPQVATGMENVDASAQPVKTIINGQLFILRGEKMYDAQGKLVK